MRAEILLGLLLAVTAVAGCLTGEPAGESDELPQEEREPTPPEETSDPEAENREVTDAPATADDREPTAQAIHEVLNLEVDHDHGDIPAHGSSFNMEEVSYLPLNDTRSDWIFGEADVRGGLAAVATIFPYGGFVLVDISDPRSPEEVGRFRIPTAAALDVKFGPNGAYALVGTGPPVNDQNWEPPGATPPLQPESAGLVGVLLVSLEDPRSPELVDTWPLPPLGPHMIEVQEIGGTPHVFASSLVGGRVAIAEIVDGPQLAKLVPVGEYTVAQGGSPNSTLSPHDMTVYDDPLYEGPLMLVATGADGIHIVDVSIPSLPRLLGAWRDHGSLYAHTVMPAIYGDQRVLFATPEMTSHDRQGPMWIIEATNLTDPSTIGTWRIPGPALTYDQNYRFSPHNLNIHDGRLYLAHYHAGAWVLDISSPALAANPEPIGALIPAGTINNGLPSSPTFESAPMVWDVVPIDDRHALISDMFTGSYIAAVDQTARHT